MPFKSFISSRGIVVLFLFGLTSVLDDLADVVLFIVCLLKLFSTLLTPGSSGLNLSPFFLFFLLF